MPLRFPRYACLIHSVDFSDTIRTGKKIHTPFFSIYKKENNKPFARLGVIITKKNVRNATKRNQVKRVIRESFRYNQILLSGLDILVYTHKPITNLSKKQQRDFLDQTWLKLIPYKKSF